MIEPVPDVFLDFWHCNSTGVYSGVIANGNGNSNDESNLDTTFLRGLRKSDSLGVTSVHTLFPGHYTGRATHIHVLSHPANETTVNKNNNTISGLYTSNSSHVGQIFFDQDLISLVEATAPYNTNTQELTTNAEDSILGEEAADMDPFVEWIQLGDDITDGVMAWISIGIDPTADDEISSAATIYKDGGVANENSGMGGGPGGPGGEGPDGNGTVPTGAPPMA